MTLIYSSITRSGAHNHHLFCTGTFIAYSSVISITLYLIVAGRSGIEEAFWWVVGVGFTCFADVFFGVSGFQGDGSQSDRGALACLFFLSFRN
jgi:hypothetical protein